MLNLATIFVHVFQEALSIRLLSLLLKKNLILVSTLGLKIIIREAMTSLGGADLELASCR